MSRHRCKDLRKALSTILANPVLPAETILVEVIRSREPHADVSFMDEDLDMTCHFSSRNQKPVLSELHDSQVFRIVSN